MLKFRSTDKSRTLKKKVNQQKSYV